jgi:DNA-binding NtrC family response regulator
LNEAAERAVRMVERQKIADALAQCDGNKTRAAEVLAVGYKTLLTKIKDYNL